MITPVLTKLIEADGITAACGGERGAFEFGFSSAVLPTERDQIKEIFAAMLRLLDTLPEGQEELKITLATQSLLLRQSRGTYVGVVAVKGHPVIKSLQRTVRRAFAKLGAPLRQVRPRSKPVPAGVPTTADTAPTRPLTLVPDPPLTDDDNGFF